MTVTQGQGVDQATVEQVKALHRLGKNQKDIAKLTGASISTVRRYITRPDVSPMQEEARDAEMEQFVKRGWGMILDDFMTAIEKHKHLLDNMKSTKEMKEVMTMLGIMFDKLGIVHANTRPSGGVRVPALVINVSCPSQPDILANAGAVLYVDGEVPGDGGGPGSGEDVSRMLGSGTEVVSPEN